MRASNYLILDTETTGFPRKGELVQEGQARICQMAMILCDSTGKIMAEHVSLIQPDGWTISESAFGTHGIDEQTCEKYGLKISGVMNLFKRFHDMADVVVCHNAKFDRQMIEIELMYNNVHLDQNEWYCTMLNSVDACRLPGKFGKFKWPKLGEALHVLCHREMPEGLAHDAMVDAKACKDVFFALNKGVTNDI